MTNIEVITFSASIASLVLAIIAIWLSIVFFRMSSELSEKSTEAAKGINASVEKLEKLFDKLYADTFSMMRDTVSDMRKHIWPEEPVSDDKISNEIEQRANEKIEVLKNEMEAEVSSVLHRQRVTDSKLSAITGEMKELLDKAIVDSRKVEVEAREETIRDALLDFIRSNNKRNKGKVIAGEMVGILSERFEPSRTINELTKMRGEGLISFAPANKALGPSTEIRISSKVPA